MFKRPRSYCLGIHSIQEQRQLKTCKAETTMLTDKTSDCVEKTSNIEKCQTKCKKGNALLSDLLIIVLADIPYKTRANRIM